MRLFVFGIGYSSLACISSLRDKLSWVGGTSRSLEKSGQLLKKGIAPYQFDGCTSDPEIANVLKQSTHLLISIPPTSEGDAVLNTFSETLFESKVEWIGYLSTVGVYGNHKGLWVNEESECRPRSERSIIRLETEKKWMDLATKSHKNLSILRLSGIYGPGRNALVNIENGKAKRIVKIGQVFNRIYVEDIAGAVATAIEKSANGIFNVTDDEPAPPQDVVEFAANLLDVEPPPVIPFESAEMSQMARSFYSENKRVSNQRMKNELGYRPKFPNFRHALQHMHNHGWK